MAYSELIKNFERIREYMRDFYVYGFKRRDEYDAKSARSYDNERRRIESWLGEYMAFRQDASGKQVFISIDSRNIINNPLYNAFKAKSFTANDIMLHFFLLDALSDGSDYTTRTITELLGDEYLSCLDNPPTLDESTVRNKLKEYERLGLFTSEKKGKQLHYKLCAENVNLENWSDAIAFFAEENPLGVIGSFLADKLSEAPDYFRFKHHYILHAMESEILLSLLEAISAQKRISIDIYNPRRGKPATQTVTPLKIYISTQGGRRYLMAHSHYSHRISLYRLDSIKAVKAFDIDKNFAQHIEKTSAFEQHLWGVSSGALRELEHIEMTVFAAANEGYIVSRLEREKRCGCVETLGDGLYRFSADVYDATELLPWLRTFIGRIREFKCSNTHVQETFLSDLLEMERMYSGGESDAIS